MWCRCSGHLAGVTPMSPEGAALEQRPLPSREGAVGRGQANPALWLMAAYGFVAGLPLPLSGFTFRLWLSEGGVSLAADRPDREYRPRLLAEIPLGAGPGQRPAPGPLRRLGRRRGWLAAIQPALAAAAALLALSDPGAPAVPFPRARRAGRLPLRQPGHRSGCLAHRDLSPAPPGRRDGRLHLGLPRRSADRRRPA